MTYRALVTDLDGTLLDEQGRVHGADAEAIAELQHRGVVVSIATGRMFSGTRRIAREIGVEGPVACVDGSHIADALDGRERSCAPIPLASADPLLAGLARHRPVTYVFAHDRVYHDERGEPFLQYVRTWSEELHAVEDVLDPGHWGSEPSIAAVVGLGTEEQIRGVVDHVAEAGHPIACAAFAVRKAGIEGVWGMVVRSHGVDKGTALSWLAEHHGVSTDEVVAVGDWVNDIPMLRAAGRSFAMAQAPDTVRAAATDVLEASVATGGGIREAARRAGLL